MLRDPTRPASATAQSRQGSPDGFMVSLLTRTTLGLPERTTHG